MKTHTNADGKARCGSRSTNFSDNPDCLNCVRLRVSDAERTTQIGSDGDGRGFADVTSGERFQYDGQTFVKRNDVEAVRESDGYVMNF